MSFSVATLARLTQSFGKCPAPPPLGHRCLPAQPAQDMAISKIGKISKTEEKTKKKTFFSKSVPTVLSIILQCYNPKFTAPNSHRRPRNNSAPVPSWFQTGKHAKPMILHAKPSKRHCNLPRPRPAKAEISESERSTGTELFLGRQRELGAVNLRLLH